MEKIAEALQQNRSVSKVHYSHNFGMEDSATETLARALEKSDSVHRVDINYSDTREAEVEATAEEERVEHNSSVTELCLVDSPGNCRHSRDSQTQRRHCSDRSERQQHHSRRHESCV